MGYCTDVHGLLEAIEGVMTDANIIAGLSGVKAGDIAAGDEAAEFSFDDVQFGERGDGRLAGAGLVRMVDMDFKGGGHRVVAEAMAVGHRRGGRG